MRRATLKTARHAPVTVANTCYGRANVDARVRPDAAAAQLLDGAREIAPAIVWSSPASRCSLVARQLAQHLGCDVRIDEALCELDFGRWEGRLWADIAEHDRDAYEEWMQSWETQAPYDGERPCDIERRVRRWAAGLRGANLLVAHAGVVRALHVITEGLSWSEAMSLAVPHLAWRTFTFDDEHTAGDGRA